MESVVTGNATAQAYEPRYIRLNANDNVALVVNDLGLPPKTRFACGLELRSFVPQRHKGALSDIAAGAAVRRYREGSGTAARPCLAGGRAEARGLHLAPPAELAHDALRT